MANKEDMQEDGVVVVMTDEEGNEYYYEEEMIIPVGDDKYALLIGIHNDEDGLWISFPDIEGCNSVGNDIEDVIANGEEALGLYLATLIESGQRMPEMTRLEDVVISNSDIKTYISVDVDKYHRDMRSIKKTVSIPAWQAKAAQKQQLSLSKVLQQALNTILV